MARKINYFINYSKKDNTEKLFDIVINMFETLRKNVDQSKVELIEMDCDINAEVFGVTAAKKLIELLGK
jgi:hypothetical protein